MDSKRAGNISNTPLSVEYARPARAANHFAARYIAWGTVGMLVGGALLLFEIIGALLLFVTAFNPNAPPIPIASLVYVIFSMYCDGLLLVGAAASLRRVRWARRLLLSSAKGQMAIAGIILITIWWSIPWRRLAPDQLSLMRTIAGVFVARCAYAMLCWRLYRDVRADWYFDDHGERPGLPFRTTSVQQPADSRAAVIKPVLVDRFRVRGVDAKTRGNIVFLSKAKTPELAHMSAVTMGLDPATIVIEPILDASSSANCDPIDNG